MNSDILSEEYAERFVDTDRYDWRTEDFLRGLAAAIQDSNLEWRPGLTELVELLPPASASNRLVLAGAAYGSGKSIKEKYPGPSILLFGAALNAIGSEPQVELEEAIAAALPKLKEASVLEDPDVAEIVRAAKERARFDKVGAMLRSEFAAGLQLAGKYTIEEIDDVVPKIIRVTHDVRHKGLIDRFGWAVASLDGEKFSADPRQVKEKRSSTSIEYLHEEGQIIYTKSWLEDLIPYAQEGCAYAISSRMLKRNEELPYEFRT